MLGASLLVGGACEKKPNNADTGAINALDRTGSGAATAIDTTPLKGIDVSKLEADKQQIFYKLVGSLKSPCGKSESLRVSFTTDTACKRAPFAVRYILAFLEDEVPEDKVLEAYTAKYESPNKPVKLETGKAPRVGNDDAPVRIVEFYDYACGHCREFKEVLDKATEEHPGKVVSYFLMFPLGVKEWPHSKSAGQAAIAAHAQGKFKEMHALLFEKGVVPHGQVPPHSESDVLAYAKQLGLDVTKFAADYKAAAAQVEADHAQGKSVGVSGTPGVFFNDRKYEGPLHPKYLGMWIEEENAVNR